MDNPLAYTFLKMLQDLIFFFGIHPSVLRPITSLISTQFLAENIAAIQAGHVATHFYAPGPESAFGNFTGSGVTIGCVFWCLTVSYTHLCDHIRRNISFIILHTFIDF